MTELQPPPFKCPNCDAQYKVVRVEAAPTHDREITCRNCGAPLRGREGQFVLKYFLLRPSGEFKRRGTLSCNRHGAHAKVTACAPSRERVPQDLSPGIPVLGLSFMAASFDG